MRERQRPWPAPGSALLLALAIAAAIMGCENPFVQKIKAIRALAASPVIGVAAQGGSAIANSGSFDFGSVSISKAQDQVFTVSNAGKTALTISASIGGSDAAAFSFSASPPGSVEPLGSAQFTLRFSPSSIGSKSASLIFATNDVSSNTFTFTLTGKGIDQAASPTFVGGNYQRFPSLASGGIVSITINCVTTGAKIYYSTNGSTPALDSLGVSTFLYSAAFPYVVPDTGTGVIKAVAKADGLSDSELATAFFSKQVIDPPVVTPSIPFSDYYYPTDTPLNFSIASATSNAIILFTVDGMSTPAFAGAIDAASGVSSASYSYYLTNGGSFTYAGPHTGNQLVIKALGYVVGSPPSSSATTTSTTYKFKLATPVFSGVKPQDEYFASAPSVTLSSDNAGAPLYYTVGGATPSSSSTAYTAPIEAPSGADGSSATTTIKAIAIQADWLDSEVLTGVFNVCGKGIWDSSKWNQATWQD